MKFTETGETVYQRTYSRTKPNGEKETWPETVRRVVDGNLGLVPDNRWTDSERDRLVDLMEEFKILPAGRHLWASGVKGRQYLFNCHVSGWSGRMTDGGRGIRLSPIADHFEFTFLRLMEGGGVGANYSNRFLEQYDEVRRTLEVHIVCDPEHPDALKMLEAGVLSDEYNADWEGSFEVEDSREGWAEALTDLLRTYYRSDVKNYKRVFDVSRVRAEGSRLKTFGGRASGPLPLAVMLREVAEVMNDHFRIKLTGIGAMEIDHAIAKCVVSGGNRRSARMAIMHWKDPQIEAFLKCKEDTGKHWTTNISVEVDDEFWAALEHELAPEFPDRSTREDSLSVMATLALRDIAEGMLRDGEPGIWDSSYSNLGEPNQVVATNPCGEIALESWENCNLGHINLAAFVDEYGRVDGEEMAEAHRLMTRFLIRATYGDVNDPKQASTLARNRRIGVGHLGVASYLGMRGIRYSDAPWDTGFHRLLRGLAKEVESAAEQYAHELRIPVPVKTRTVAPTGTIAKMPGVSEGIHPIFAKYFLRRIRFSNIDQDQWAQALEYATKGYNVEPCQYAPDTTVVEIPTKDILLEAVSAIYGDEEAERIVESAADMSLSDMLEFQSMYQTYWADNAVSYTANIDPEVYTVPQLELVIKEFGGEVKGFTVFPEKSRPQSPYERLTREQFEAFEATQTGDGVDEDCASGSCPVR